MARNDDREQLKLGASAVLSVLGCEALGEGRPICDTNANMLSVDSVIDLLGPAGDGALGTSSAAVGGAARVAQVGVAISRLIRLSQTAQVLRGPPRCERDHETSKLI